jgi:streptogramin lyase
VSMSTKLMEFDAAAKTVLELTIPESPAACKMPDGQIVYLTSTGKCIRLDAAGNQVKSFTSGQDGASACVLDLTPRGHLLVSRWRQNVFEEFDLEGQSIRQARGPGTSNATAVRNGHVMVTNYYGGGVLEMDPAGKVVWQYQAAAGYNPFLARQR